MTTTTHPSFCRMCHSACPILVDVENGVPVKVTGDPASEIYHGYSCIKGRALPEMHTSPERLLHSLKRDEHGDLVRVPVEQAMDEIAVKLEQVLRDHGPLAIALYSGTFGLANSATGPMTNAFREAFGNPRGWVATSIDQPGKTIAQGLMGVWMGLHQGPATADVCLVIGSNPLVSIAAGLPQADPRKWLHDAKQRGFKLIVIDPRRHETASQADIFLQPRPAEDVAIVAGMIRLILDEGLHDVDFVAQECNGVDELRRAVDHYTPAEVARRADIPVDDFVAAARMFATAGRGVAVAGTGPGMSSARGTLLEYLVLALNAICGRYLREGELVWNPGTLVEPVPRFAQATGPFPSYGFEPKLRVRDLGDTLVGPQTSAIADEILMPGDDQIRVLISCGGNPLASWPDQGKVRAALASLELLVQFDPWMSATAKVADYVIAPTLSLEVPSITNYIDMLPAYAPGYGLPKPWAQYASAVVEPPEGSDVIPEWEFFYGLAQRMGLELHIRPVDFNGPTGATTPVPMDVKPTADEVLELLTLKARVPLSEVKKHPNGAVYEEPASYMLPKMEGWEARLELADARMMHDLDELTERGSGDLASWAGDDYPFRLVGRRMHAHYNSGGMTAPRLQRAEPTNPAFLHPDDLAMLGVREGEVVEITSARATILGVAAAEPTLRRGLVAMAHAWGDLEEYDEKVHEIGGNTGRLADVGDAYDPYSGQPLMSNLPVRVRPRSDADASAPTTGLDAAAAS
jgi:anaerobic selenocysteine-containing dehydrogenase